MPGRCMNDFTRSTTTALTILIGCLLSSTLSLATPSARKPALQIAPPLVDLGSIREGDVAKGCYELLNQGPEPIYIHRVKAGCSCIEVDAPDKIPPRGKASVCIRLNTVGGRGTQTFKTGLYTSDPVQPMYLLHTRINITPLLTLIPDRVFIQGGLGLPLKQQILIETKGKKALKIELASHTLGERVKVRLTPVTTDKKYLLTVENRLAAPGSYRGRIFLKTNYHGREQIVVPVFTRVLAPVTVVPSPVLLTASPRTSSKGEEQKLSGTFTLRARAQKPLTITSIEPKQMGCSYLVTPLIPGEAYQVNINCIKQTPIALPSEVVIHTDRKDLPKIGVPLQY